MGPWTRSFVITGRHVLRRSTYLSCACQSGPSRGWLVRRIILPYVYAYLLAWLASADFFKNNLFHTLNICLIYLLSLFQYRHSLDDSTKLLGALCFLNLSGIFGGGSEVVGKFSQSFLCELACLFRPLSLGVSALVAGYLTIRPFVWHHFYGILLVP